MNAGMFGRVRTEMLHELAVVATLPEDAAGLVAHDFPGAEIDCPLVGGIFEERAAI